MIRHLILRLFPFVAWLPLSPLLLRADLVAGITGALVLVPKALFRRSLFSSSHKREHVMQSVYSKFPI